MALQQIRRLGARHAHVELQRVGQLAAPFEAAQRADAVLTAGLDLLELEPLEVAARLSAVDLDPEQPVEGLRRADPVALDPRGDSGVVGALDPGSGAVKVLPLDETITNSFAVDETGGVYLVRFASCVALHAVWSASVAVAIFNLQYKVDTSEPWLVAIRAALIPMVLHGLYDTLLKKDMNGWRCCEVRITRTASGLPA